ncbi:uncharacterized protein VNE69_12201 [Vairimorpha necatrix]|uniref:Reverse transcriptase domain-containing protein n=1 Tax=Vairimorpha necatrix TaxID=6039 RepID=A0AAX4JHN4_9MICR
MFASNFENQKYFLKIGIYICKRMRVRTEQEEETEKITKQTSIANIDKLDTEEKEQGPEHTSVPTQSTSETLAAVLVSTEASEEEWPQRVFLSIINRFGRMPRGGWNKATEFFCGKFGSNMSSLEFKGKAKKALTSNSGRQMTARELLVNPTKRRKAEAGSKEGNSLFETELFLKAQKLFLEKLSCIQNKCVDQVERTRKISSLKVDLLKLDATVKANLQAAQICYQEMASKKPKPSSWKESILKKITEIKDKVVLIKKARAFDKLSNEEKREVKKVMRELNMLASLHRDTSEAIAILNERKAIYSRKLEVADRRREYRRENQNFELYRSNFYRKLKCANEVTLKVSKEDISSFWSTMWNKKEQSEDCNSFEEYLLEYIPDSQDQITFPTLQEFAAGCDGIFIFFIKKCEALHPFLYKIVKEVCLDGKEPEAWFYKGITYLIPKGTPTSGNDFRPITCMSNLYKLTTKCTTRVMQLIVESRGLLAENQLGTVRQVQGAKEQAMVNIAVNKEHGNKLKTMWIDVKKAYDSVDHSYLLTCISKLNLPQ